MNQPSPIVLECGKSIDELSDYLSRERTPRDPEIETCPECLSALEGLNRIAQLSRDLITHDATLLPDPAESWFTNIIANIASEVRTGRSLPLHHDDSRVALSVTEGAVRTLVRSVGDEVDGVVIGRCDIAGDAETPHAPVEIMLTASLLWGLSAQETSHILRGRVHDALQKHTELNVTAINIEIDDLHGPFPDAKATT